MHAGAMPLYSEDGLEDQALMCIALGCSSNRLERVDGLSLHNDTGEPEMQRRGSGYAREGLPRLHPQKMSGLDDENEG